MLVFFESLAFLNLFSWLFRRLLWYCRRALTKRCSASSLIHLISFTNVSTGGILALAEYWKDLGHVLSFICFSSFLMESFDFVILVSKETVSMCFLFLFGRLFFADSLGWLFSFMYW